VQCSTASLTGDEGPRLVHQEGSVVILCIDRVADLAVTWVDPHHSGAAIIPGRAHVEIVGLPVRITVDLVETINGRLGDSFQCWPIKASEEAGEIWRDAGRRTR
jgi:hypothetical protein